MERELSKIAYYSMPRQQPAVQKKDNNASLLQKPERKTAPNKSIENRPAMTAYIVFDALRKKRQELNNA